MKPSFPLKDGSYWTPDELFWNLLCSVYGEQLVMREIPKAQIWLVANPENRKTARGMTRFLNGWMSRAEPLPKANVVAFDESAALNYWAVIRSNGGPKWKQAPDWAKRQLETRTN